MKTILYILIAIILFGIVTTGFAKKTHVKKTLLIQSVENSSSSADLSESAKVISKRLKDFSSEKFEISLIKEKNQVEINFSDNWDIKTIENLLIKKGTLEFYETYNHKSLPILLNGDTKLFSLMTSIDSVQQGAKIGCASLAEVGKINDYLNSLDFSNKCKFAWSYNSESSEACLFALKPGLEKTPLLTAVDIENIRYYQDGQTGDYNIEIIFKKSAVKLWSDATKSNINNAIAIVSDGNVIYAPLVRSEINNGICEISGNFSESDAKYFAALVNNGELTSSFKIVK